MQHPVYLVELLIAAALPIPFLLSGLLDLRRDFLFFCVYLQFLLYVYVGPYLWLRGGSSAASGSYEWLGASALGLCGGALMAAYMLSLRGHRRVRGSDPARLEVSPRRFELLLVILMAFSFTFWMIAWSHGIILRRLGSGLLPRQFTLRFPEFVVYRLYIESLPFLVALVVAGLVAARGRLSWHARAGAALVLLSAYFFRTVNSRHELALGLLIALGVWAALSGGQAGFWPRFAVGCVLSAVLLLYSNSVTEKVRVAVGTGQSLWRAFSPFSPMEERPPVPARGPTAASSTPPGKGKAGSPGPGTLSASTEQRSFLSESFLYVASTETPIATRLNGLDLIVQMEPALEARGFAWGRAWKIPAALVVLPVIDPAKARAYKLTYDITAKNYLMRHYTDLPDTDHVSCILTDAYGNFGLLGFERFPFLFAVPHGQDEPCALPG